MNKRYSVRQESRIPATAVEGRGRSWPCVIRNYCAGGLFVEPVEVRGNASHRADHRPAEGAPVEIRFPGPEAKGQGGLHRIATRVAHATPTGMGLAFVEPEDGVREVLQAAQEARQSRRARHPGRNGARRNTDLLERVGRTFVEAVRSAYPDLLREAESRLMDAADRTHSSTLQQEHLRAARMLRTSERSLGESWKAELEGAWQGLAAGEADAPQPSGAGARRQRSWDLELVDKDSFDRWLAYAGLVSRMEAELYSQLYELEQRVSELCGQTLSKETNPLGPSALVWGLKEALDPFELHVDSQRTLLRALHRVLVPVLDSTYESINTVLSSEGVLPVMPRTPAAAPSRPKPEAERPQRSAPDRFLHTLRRVVMPEPAAEGASARGAAGRAEEGEPAAEPYDVEQVMQALSEIQLVKNQPLLEQVQEALARSGGGGSRPLGPNVEGAIQAAESLVRSFTEDDRGGVLVRDAIQRLEVPLVKAAVEHPDFLNDAGHPAVEVVNALDKLALSLSAEPPGGRQASELSSVIDQVSSSLSRDQRGGGRAFAEARDALKPYVDEYERLFEHNRQRVVESCEGQERLDEGRRAVLEAVRQAVGDAPPAAAVGRLLEVGWGQLMVLSWLAEGPDSTRWRNQLAAVQGLSELLPPRAPDRLPDSRVAEELLTALEAGLAEVPFRPARQRELLEELRAGLTRDPAVLGSLCREPRTPAPDPVRIVGKLEADEPIPETERSTLKPWLKTIESLAEGDWLIEHREGGRSRAVSLAWKNPGRSRFAFVDGRGFKALHCGVGQLAHSLQSGRLSLLEDGRLPLVERAVERVLRDTYDRMAFESAHDPLTGLMNRRSFESRLRESLERAHNENSRHVLIMLDVDRFKLINDVCGHEGGDRLLKEISNILRTYLQEGAELARTGDDEFAILIENCTEEYGLRIAETQRRAVENLDFRWEGRPFSVSASLGMVSVDGAAESVSQLLREVDSACFLAKEGGRNTTKMFEPSDKEVRSHQGAMKAVPVVEQAVQEGRLKLYAQLIEPVFLDEGDREHYEILLRILDDRGNPLPPAELIQAAERFDRMRSLDRWVVEHALEWIDRHCDELDETGGFSINLSGHSLGDPGMLRTILDALEKTCYPREKLAFEITETAMVRNMAAAREFVEKIKELGCRFFLDDFGSGMSSYSYLKDFPVDCIKIDGAFIRNIARDEKDLALVKSITEIAHFSERKVIAEYVEDEATLVKLRELQVDFVQGYAVGRPFPLAKLASNG